MAATATILNFEDYRLHAFQRHGNRLPWFVLAEVCKVLDIADPHTTLRRLDDDERHSMPVTDASGRRQEMLCVSLSGLSRIADTSRKPIGKRFSKWLHSEVVVSIFLTGEFKGDSSPLEELVGTFQPLLDLPEPQKPAEVIPLHKPTQEELNAEANRRHLEALVGGPRARWCEHIEADIKVHGIPFAKLPLTIRQLWWQETDYNRKPASPEFLARLKELLENMDTIDGQHRMSYMPDYERDADPDDPVL